MCDLRTYVQKPFAGSWGWAITCSSRPSETHSVAGPNVPPRCGMNTVGYSAKDTGKNEGTMSRPKLDEQDLVVRAAWAYYMHGHGQAEIAKALNLSRTKVTRLLSQAREAGIVRISLDHEMVETLALADWVSATYEVEEVILTPPLPHDPETSPTIDELSRRAVGMAAANLLERKAQTGGPVRVGLGAGRTIGRVVDAVANLTKSDLTVQALLGATHIDDGLSCYSLALDLARCTGGVAQTLPLPLFTGTGQSNAAMANDPMIARLIDTTAHTDFNILSCGPVAPSSAFSHRAGVSDLDMEDLMARGAVCEIAGLFLNESGAPVRTALDARRIGVAWEVLSDRPNIVVAAGAPKARALRAVMKAGLAQAIVVDHALVAELTRPQA